jgi:hypothetical protein
MKTNPLRLETMSSNKFSYQVGKHRPVYLWAGPGTVRMNRLKFMNPLVDVRVHMEAHNPTGAERMAWEAGFNWAYLTYDWGFPPEIAHEDWIEFQQALRVYQAAGMGVFGYIQASNCVYTGSYVDKDWYAKDPKGRTFPYYTGRLMTCWSSPEWLEHLREMVRGVVEAGSEGVFFDNLWHGLQPFHMAGAWLGGAGCYCSRCQTAYQQRTGFRIPKRIAPEKDSASREYLQWRAEQVTQTISDLAWYARSLNSKIQISANNFDAIMRPSYLIFGIDLPALAEIQDVVMIEDYGLPKWQPAGKNEETPRLINNALTLHNAAALAGETPVTTLPYDQGIGFDELYPLRSYRQGIAEAAACGAPAVVKGTEYFHQGRFTLLTALKFSPHRKAIGQIHQWLAENEHLYRDRVNAAQVGLLYPGDALWQNWDRMAPIYFGAGQALLASGIPWRVVVPGGDPRGLEMLLSFEDDPEMHVTVMMEERLEAVGTRKEMGKLRRIHVPGLPGWQLFKPGFLGRHPTLRMLAASLVRRTHAAYFNRTWVRKLGDRYGLTQQYHSSPFFHVPPAQERRILMEAVGERPLPSVQADVPVLVEHWLAGHVHQLHLVNYASRPQSAHVELPQAVHGQVLSPDHAPLPFSGDRLDLEIDVYSVLVYEIS